jgi:tetratricopeptide (TPR) repeat protein
MYKIILASLVFLLVSAIGATGQNKTNYTSQGRYELSKGRYVSAIELFNKAIHLSKFNSVAFFLRGIAKYELEDFIGGEKDFTQVLELNPKNHEAFLFRGVCNSQQLKYTEAFSDYNESIKLDDEDWRAYSNRSLASLLLDRYVDVISDCNKIIDLKKESSYTYLVRGEAKAGLEMYKVAIEDFERAMKMDSLAMRPVLHRGIALGKLKNFDAAITDFELAMILDPENALPLFHRGTVKSEMGRMKEALNDFNVVLEKYPDNAVVLFNRAMVYSSMKKDSAALIDYNRVVQLNPKNILGYFNRGILKHNKKDYLGALEGYNKAIELFPHFLDAHENRTDVLQRLGMKLEYEMALIDLNRIKSFIAISDEEAKLEQHIKLMKATELKGDFEPIPQEVGKIQHQEVDVRLLPFYQISAFPESDANISVYDGFNRPYYYDAGAIAFVENGRSKRNDIELQLELTITQSSRPKDVVRLATLRAMIGDFDGARNQLERCLESGKKEAICYFTRAVISQMELDALQETHTEKTGSLDIIDSVYQSNIEALLAVAELDYRKVLELDSDMSFTRFNLGHLLATAERYEEAETQFGLAASSKGNFIEANYNRGLIRILIGKVSKGCEDMSLAGELGLTDSYNVIKRYCE